MSIAKEATNIFSDIQSGAIPLATVYAVTAAVLIGTLIVAGVGFAGPEIMHNAAHDLRHGLAFPCH